MKTPEIGSIYRLGVLRNSNRYIIMQIKDGRVWFTDVDSGHTGSRPLKQFNQEFEKEIK